MGNLVGRVMQVGERRVKVGAVIGEGGFSFIHIAHEADTGKPFVLKRSVCQDSDSLLQATTEMDLMRKLPKHPNIVNFYGATHMRNANEVIEVFLLLEFCEAGAISDFVRKRGALSFVDVLHVFEDACYAVGHLHAHAKEIREELERVQVTTTMQYRAPEMLDLHRYREITTKCDVWALGCVLFQLAFGEHPFGQGDLQIINAVYKIPDSSPHPHALDHLIILALQPDPVQRPSALKLHRLSRAISHPGPQASLRVHVPGEERMAKEEEEPEPPKLRQPPPHVHPAIVPDNDSDSDSVVVSTTSNEEDQDEERVADKRVVVGERTAPRSQVAMQLPLGGEEGAVGGDGAALARLHALVDYVAAFLNHQPPNVGARFHATLPPELQALFARARAESDEKDLSAALARELEGEGIGLLTARQSVDDGEEESESYWNPGELEAMGHGHERAVPAIAGGDEKGVRNEGKDSTKGDDGNEEDEGEGEGEGEGERCEEKRQEEGEELPRQEAAKEAGEVELAEQARAQAKEEQDERKGKGEQGHDPLLHEQGPGEDAPQQGDGAAKEQALSCGDKAHSVGSCTDKARGKKAKRVTFAEKREEIPGPKSDTKHLDILESDPSDVEMSPVHAPLAEDPSQAAVRKTLVLDARVEWDGDEGDSSSSSSSYESFPESEEEGKEGKGEDLEEDQEGGEDKEEEEEEEGSEEDERAANPQGHQAVGRAGSGGGEDGDDERDEPEQESEVRGTASGVEVPARAPEEQPPPPPQPQEQQQSQPQQSPPKQQQSPPRQGGESAKAEGERQGGSEGSRGRDEAANSTPGEVGSTARGQRNGDALGKNANGTAAQQHQHASPAAVAERKGGPAQGNGSGTKPDSPARSSSLPVLRKPPEHPRRRASRPSDWVVFKSAHQGT